LVFIGFYNVGTWSTCEFEVDLRSGGKRRGERKGERERERECVCVRRDGADCNGHALLQRRSWGFVTA